MKRLLILTVGICLLISIPVVADQAEDEAAIREACTQMFAEGNKQNAKAFIEFLTEEFEDWTGDTKGRAEWEKSLADTFKGNPQFALSDDIGIIFVTPDVAIYKFIQKITGLLSDDGKPMPVQKRLRAFVYVKKDGRWLAATYFWRTIEE